MRFPSSATLKKLLPKALEANFFYLKTLNLLKENLPSIINTLTKILTFKNILLGIIALLLLGIGALYFIIKKDPILYWEQAREMLMFIKDYLSTDLPKPVVEEVVKPDSFLSKLDKLIINCYFNILSCLTYENVKNSLHFSLQILDYISIRGLAIANFVCTHWVVLTAGTVTLPILNYFNFLYINTITHAIFSPIIFSFQKVMEAIANVLIAYRALEIPIIQFLHYLSGGAAWLITLPVNIAAHCVHMWLLSLKFVINLCVAGFKWVSTKLKQIWEALINIFFPRPGGIGPSNSFTGGNDSSSGGGGSSSNGGSGQSVLRSLGIGAGSIAATSGLLTTYNVNRFNWGGSNAFSGDLLGDTVATQVPIEPEIITIAEEAALTALVFDLSVMFLILKGICIISAPLLLIKI